MIGPHILYPTEEALAWAGQAKLVKILNGDDQGSTYQKVLDVLQPETTIVLRIIVDQETQEEMLTAPDGPERLRQLYYRLEGLSFPPRCTIYVESLNEIGQRLGQGLEQRCDFEERFVQLSQFPVIGFNLSTGGYEWADASYMASRNYCGVKAIGVHEYWRYTPESDSDWVFRYKTFLQDNAAANGVECPPIFVGECGFGSTDPYKGWKSGQLTAQRFASQLKYYERFLGPGVIGCTPFTSGANGDMWDNFDVDPVWRYL